MAQSVAESSYGKGFGIQQGQISTLPWLGLVCPAAKASHSQTHIWATMNVQMQEETALYPCNM
jgi:hypothetical protein